MSGQTRIVKKRKSRLTSIGKFCVMALVVLSALFVSISVVFLVGLMPTFVLSLFGPKGSFYKVYTIGVLNVTGCLPFVYDVWRAGLDFSRSMEIVTDPLAVTIMYTAAAFGYMIHWSVTGLVSGFMLTSGKSRYEKIRKEKQKLVDRWGPEVTGYFELDLDGFAKYPDKIKNFSLDKFEGKTSDEDEADE